MSRYKINSVTSDPSSALVLVGASQLNAFIRQNLNKTKNAGQSTHTGAFRNYQLMAVHVRGFASDFEQPRELH